MDPRFLLERCNGGVSGGEHNRPNHAARFLRYPLVAVMSFTALGCGDDGAEPGGGSGENSTEMSPEAGLPPASSADGGFDRTSRETSTEPAPTGGATSAGSGETSAPGTGDTDWTTDPSLTTDTSGTESTNGASDSDATSSLPVGDGRLSGLSASGELTPAFDVDVHEYDVTLPAFATRLVLTAELESGGFLDVEGAPFGPNGVWTSGPIDVGTTTFTMTWERADGEVQVYTFNTRRLDTTWEYTGMPYDAPHSYGANTALSGDGTTLAIGSSRGGSETDGARVYVRSGEEWTMQAHLLHPSLLEEDSGAWALELSEDGSTLVAGARSQNAAYVFDRTDDGWELTAELTGLDADGFTAYSFGDSVAISGDGNVIAVGTIRHTDWGGAVYTFQKNAGTWESLARLVPAPAEPGPYGTDCLFDIALALDGSGKTLAIGNSPFTGCSPAIDVYESAGAAWTKTSVLGGEKQGPFGRDVDLNSDGRVLVVAGQQQWGVYTKTSQGWAEQPHDDRPAYKIEVTDSGDMVVTNDAVFLRTPHGWTFETLLPEAKAVRWDASTGLSMSGDGSTVALGSHVYSARSALWTALSEQPAGNTNCEERSQDVAGACLYELACDAERVEATCDVQEDGTWRCACYGAAQGELREFIVSGGDESSVCQLSATLCVEGNDNPGETECTREITPGSNDCREHETCVTKIGLDEGVEATFEVITQTLSCWTSSLGDVYCECGDGSYFDPTIETFAFFGAEAEQACSLFKGICEGTVPVGQEQHCAEPRIDITDYDDCTAKRACGARTLLDEAGEVYTLSSLFGSEVSCDNFNAADECTCGTFNTYAAGLLVVDSTRPETSCLVADAVCFGAVGVEASEAFECAVTNSQVEDERCSATADCGLTLEFEGTSVSATESVDVECIQGADDRWSCDCTRGWDDDHQFSVDAASAGSACNVAAVECAGRGTPLDSTQGQP